MAVKRAMQTVNVAPGGAAQLDAGKLVVTDGQCAPELKVEVTYHLTSVAPALAMTDAERIALSGSLQMQIEQTCEGLQSNKTPIDFKGMNLVRDMEDDYLRRDTSLWADALTGMATAFPGGDQDVICEYSYPTGRDNRIRQLMQGVGIGPSQAKQLCIRFQLAAAPALPAGVTMKATGVTIRIYPDEEPTVGNPWVWIPECRVLAPTGTTPTLADGMHHAVFETSAAHPATPLTELATGFDDEKIYDGTNPAQALRQWQNDFDLPAVSDLSGRYTQLYVLPGVTDLRAQPERVHTGKFWVYDRNEDMAGVWAILDLFQGHWLPADYLAIHHYVAAHRQNPVRGTSGFAVRGHSGVLHSRFQPLFGIVFFTAADRQWEQYASYWGASTDKQLAMFIPPLARAKLKAAVETKRKAQEHKTAAKMLDAAATALPDVVQSGRGLKKGSAARAAFEAKVMA